MSKKALKPTEEESGAGKRKFSEARILQITNDIAEDIESGSPAELRAVASYWADKACKAREQLQEIQFLLTAKKSGGELKRAMEVNIAEWLKKSEVAR